MSEKEPLLLSSSSLGPGPVSKVLMEIKRVEGMVKSAYIKAVRLIYARDFMAELLATFILVVSLVLFMPVHCSREL